MFYMKITKACGLLKLQVEILGRKWAQLAMSFCIGRQKYIIS